VWWCIQQHGVCIFIFADCCDAFKTLNIIDCSLNHESIDWCVYRDLLFNSCELAWFYYIFKQFNIIVCSDFIIFLISN